jgi:hypothetical protein
VVQALQELRGVGSNIVGTVLSRVHPRVYGRYKYYGKRLRQA